MSWLLLVAMLFVTGFTDPVSCTVQGYVWRLTDAEDVAWTKGNECTGVKVQAEANTLVLSSPTHWVMVIISAEKGTRRFAYRWGSELAHVGAETVPVVWGSVKRG